ncbi:MULTISPECIES: nuclear transport factor 2 family protein [Burkholderia]|uniref:nuclear transport factor 2 family protein n=1 Tax=Burkholderia TaxID=32008 RepID=UPI000E65406A|nr:MULTISPECIES: nuclear transport factor 2 family protein [Burkholderia]MCR5898359.1 polyketide cyclase [Burkholderia sp. HAN2018]
MTHPDADARHIYEGWHAAVVARDVDALMALYTDDAVLETPLIVVTLPDHGSGVLHGKAAIGAFFAAGLRNPGSRLGRWYRTGLFFSNGRQLTWEYPRATPEGDQVDLVEVMDLRDGLIAHHRVYWGWVGFLALRAAAPAPDHA